MLKPIPPPQYWWTGDADEWASQQLGIPYDYKQDWPWEVAEKKYLDRYFQIYSQIEAHAPASRRIVMMEMILEAASNGTPSGSLTTVELQEVWPRIKALLDQDADMLATTALYWCCWYLEEQDVEENAFRVSPYMRDWWRENYPIPTEEEKENGGGLAHD